MPISADQLAVLEAIAARQPVPERLVLVLAELRTWGWVDANMQGCGYGAAVMREINLILDEDHALGALATGDSAFYAKRCRESWRGRIWVPTPDGERVRPAGEHGADKVFRTPRTPRDLDIPIAIDWRPEELW